MIYLERPTDFSSKLEIVSCFLEHDGKFLMLLRHSGKPQGNTWGVPAGKVEQNEHVLDAMVRELGEETGYTADASALQFSQTVFVRYPDFDFVYHIFALPLAGHHDVVLEPSAHHDFAWVTPEEALTKNLIPDQDACIQLHYHISS